MSVSDDETKSELMRGLTSVLPAVRVKAARGLAKHAEHAREALVTLLANTDDQDQSVRESAVQAIGGIGGDAVPILIRLLGHWCKYVRRNAVWALGKLGAEAVPAVRPLCHTLKDSDPRAAGGAAQALGAIGRPAAEAVPHLAETMRGTNVVLCRLASKALSQIGLPALATLVAHLKHHDPFVQGEAAVALGWMGPSAASAVPALMDHLIVPTAADRPNRMASFGGSGAVTPVAIAPPQANAAEATTLVQVIQALGRIGAAAAAAEPHLLSLSADPREAVRQAAGEAIRLIRNE